jgi:predicted phosphodiesterase
MKLAVISDIHGNLEALKGVLEDIDRSDIDDIICLGDNVGYGPDPEAVVGLLRDRGIPSVMGNHEWGLLDEGHLSWFNPSARRVSIETRKLISDETMEYIRGLPFFMTLEGCRFVHGFPPDEVATYLFDVTWNRFEEMFQDMKEGICFVGHTHTLRLISYSEGDVKSIPLFKGPNTLFIDNKYIVNAGSVGQPRDGHNEAKYVVWDDSTLVLVVRLLSYDIQKTVDKIIALGFPRRYADILW